MDKFFLRLGFAAAIVLCAAAPALAESPDSAHEEEVQAVWKTLRIEFRYDDGQTIYNCGSLRKKLATILQVLGAHEHIRIQSEHCDELGRSRFTVVLASPVEAAEENVRALTSYTTEQLLIARTRGMRLPGAEDLQRFPAHWRTVSFARDRDMRLAPGDCELVRQLKQQILPHLSVRIVRDNLRCESPTFVNPRLTVAALIATQPPE